MSAKAAEVKAEVETAKTVDPFASAEVVQIPSSAAGRKAREIAESARNFYAKLTSARRTDGKDWVSQAFAVTLNRENFGPLVSDLRLLAVKDEGVTLSITHETAVEKDVKSGKDRTVPVFDNDGNIRVTFFARNTRPRKSRNATETTSETSQDKNAA